MSSVRGSLNGKRVVITGASSGLGAECAHAFARIGAEVILVARRKTRLQKICQKIRKNGGLSSYECTDLANSQETLKLCQAIQKKYGAVHILINNAAYYLEDSPVLETSLQCWDRILNTNLRAPFILCREFLATMQKIDYGRIVNIISATNHVCGVSAFRISKTGLEILSQAIAEEINSQDISIVSFNPGWMRTETSMNGHSPKGAASAICQLVQRPANFANARVIDVVWRGRKPILRRRRK